MPTITTKGQKAEAVNARDFDIRDMIGYALGDVGNNFTFNLVNFFLMIFYTNVFGLAAALVGALFMADRLVDAFVDIIVGRLIDNSKMTARGRFTPWVMRMKFPLAASAILLFLPAAGHLPMTTRVIYSFITYLAWGIFYSFVNIPYGSMASAISGRPRDKTSLSTARSIGSASGAAIVSYVVPLIMYGSSSHQISPHRFFIGAAIFAVLGVFCYIGLTLLTVERIRIDKTERVPLGKMFSEMAHNKALVMLVIIDIIVVINQNLSGVTLTYLFNDYFQNKTAMSIALVFNFTTVILVVPFAQIMVLKFGRKESATVALFCGAAMYGLMLIIHTHSPWIFLVGLFFGSLGAGVFNLMVWAFITDVIDAQEVISGEREDGIIYGVNSFARKLAQAIAGGIGGVILTMIGYQSSSQGGAVQSESVANHLYTLAAAIPTICCLGAALLMLGYPLTRDKVVANADELARRHEAQAGQTS